MPAAAVIRRVQALSGFIGRKVPRRRSVASCFKDQGLTLEWDKRWTELNDVGVAGIVDVGVKSVDIDKNTKGEGR